MSNNYSPDADDQMPEKKSSQQLLLLLLLLLVVLFVYLYFFTGLIKPRGEQPKPQPVSEAPVKKPLPPRLEAKGAAPLAKAEEHKGAMTPAAPAKPGEAAKAAAKPAAGAKEPAAAKPAAGAKETATAKPAAGAKEAAAGKPAASAKPGAPASQAKPAAPAAQAKGAQPGAAPAHEAKPAAAAAKMPAAPSATAAKVAQKQGAAPMSAAAEPKKPKAAAKPAGPLYTLAINGDLAESEMGPVMAKLKKVGITHVVSSKQHKGETMHRLFLADFANHDEAAEELERLKLAAPDAFMLKEGGRYAVYAGSYLRDTKAATEQNRLQAKGVQLLVKSATAPVIVLNVRAGGYADQAAADKAAKALKKAGLAVKVVRLHKAEK